MRKGRKKSAKPIYTFAIVWLILSLVLPMYRLSSLLAALLISFAAAKVVERIVKFNAPRTPEPEAEPSPAYPPEVNEIIREGQRARQEMERLRKSIANPAVQDKITDLIHISDRIVEDAIHDHGDVPQIKKFLSYYLPTTIKLLNAYDRMGAQGISGENISGTMASIETMLDTAIDAYRKQLDSLFANQALDIETDIDVMNMMLRREGLTGEVLSPSDFFKGTQGSATAAQTRP